MTMSVNSPPFDECSLTVTFRDVQWGTNSR